jgi:hypothetical protein
MQGNFTFTDIDEWQRKLEENERKQKEEKAKPKWCCVKVFRAFHAVDAVELDSEDSDGLPADLAFRAFAKYLVWRRSVLSFTIFLSLCATFSRVRQNIAEGQWLVQVADIWTVFCIMLAYSNGKRGYLRSRKWVARAWIAPFLFAVANRLLDLLAAEPPALELAADAPALALWMQAACMSLLPAMAEGANVAKLTLHASPVLGWCLVAVSCMWLPFCAVLLVNADRVFAPHTTLDSLLFAAGFISFYSRNFCVSSKVVDVHSSLHQFKSEASCACGGAFQALGAILFFAAIAKQPSVFMRTYIHELSALLFFESYFVSLILSADGFLSMVLQSHKPTAQAANQPAYRRFR